MSLVAVAAGVAVATGAALQSAVGFGFALVCAPLLFAALPAEEAVGLLVLLGLEVNLLTLLGERRRPAPAREEVVPVVIWALPGSLAGVAVLRALDDVALQLLVTAGVVVALLVNRRAGAAAAATPRRTTASGAGRALAGLASGALNTSTSTGGPPVVLLLRARGLPPATVRDTLTACFIGFAPVSALALAITGTEEAIPRPWALALFVPLAAAGSLAGRRGFAHLAARDGRYERALTVVLVAAVAAGLVSVLPAP
jgi:uncharacterized membrane protein YfcA